MLRTLLVLSLLGFSPLASAAEAPSAIGSNHTRDFKDYQHRLDHALKSASKWGLHPNLERKIRDKIDDANHMTAGQFDHERQEIQGDETAKWEVKRTLAREFPGKKYDLKVVGRMKGDELHPLTGRGERDIEARLLNPTTLTERIGLARSSKLKASVSLCSAGGACVLPEIKPAAPEYVLGRTVFKLNNTLALGALVRPKFMAAAAGEGLSVLGGAKAISALGMTAAANPLTITAAAGGAAAVLFTMGRKAQKKEQNEARDQTYDWILKRGMSNTHASDAYEYYRQILRDNGNHTPAESPKEFWGHLDREVKLQQPSSPR